MADNTIPSDKPSVFDSLSTSQQVALAYPSPLPPGLAGLIFDWVGDERLELETDITDSWIEDNTAIHDQAALHPEKFTLDASSAEIVYSTPGVASAPPQPANPFPLNAPLVPALTPGAAAAQASAAPTAGGATQGTSNLWQYFQGQQDANTSRQVTVMGFVYQLWKGRQRFTIETPWGIFTSMMIERAEGTQPQDTPGRTDHRITFKKVRIAAGLLAATANPVGRAQNQAAEADPSQNGNVGQTDLSDQQTDQVMGNWTVAGQNPTD